jgi:hypothetical protein
MNTETKAMQAEINRLRSVVRDYEAEKARKERAEEIERFCVESTIELLEELWTYEEKAESECFWRLKKLAELSTDPYVSERTQKLETMYHDAINFYNKNCKERQAIKLNVKEFLAFRKGTNIYDLRNAETQEGK